MSRKGNIINVSVSRNKLEGAEAQLWTSQIEGEPDGGKKESWTNHSQFWFWFKCSDQSDVKSIAGLQDNKGGVVWVGGGTT